MFFPRLLLFLCVLSAALCAAEPKPNIVLIFADDLGINDLSCYGRKDQPTPQLDALAAQGLRFTSAYCAQPICSPSRAALLTGKCPARLHLTNFLPGRADAPSQKLLQPVIEGQLPLEETTLPELLHDAGYATACIGKWHLGGAGFGPQEQGFDFAFTGQAVTQPTETEGSKGESELTTQAEQWLEKNKDHPFFLYLAHNSPHIPFATTPAELEKYQGAFNPTYAAVVARLDDCVGRIVRKLDALGLTERTILVFASDNGGLHVLEFPGTPATHNTPFRAGKGFVYEGGLRVPLIVRWPGRVPAGSVSATPVVLGDLMPTFMEIAGLDPAKTTGPLDYVSILKLLGGGELAPRPLFWHMPNYTNQGGAPAGVMRENEYKLIENYEDGRLELYDLQQDPGEAHDLAGSFPERAKVMSEKLAAWRKSVGAQECVPNPAFDELHRWVSLGTRPADIHAAPTAAEIANDWKPWRDEMNDAVKGRQPRVTPATGDIRLHAKDATVHGTQARYESASYKNVIGYWTQPEDWASWDFDVAKAGKYEVEIQQGCAGGGSEVAVEIAGQTLHFTVENTGHFQNMILRTIGLVDLPAGKQTLAVKPQNKKGGAVMDLRRVVLRPL